MASLGFASRYLISLILVFLHTQQSRKHHAAGASKTLLLYVVTFPIIPHSSYANKSLLAPSPCGNDNIDTAKTPRHFSSGEGMHFVIAEFQYTNKWLIDCYYYGAGNDLSTPNLGTKIRIIIEPNKLIGFFVPCFFVISLFFVYFCSRNHT